MLSFVVVGFISVNAANAQDLQAGEWTGTIQPPNAETMDITYDVLVESDSISITIVAPGMGEFATTDVRMEDGNLLFAFTPGTPLTCVMKPRDGGKYRGACIDAEGEPGYLTMVPPGKK